MIDNFFMIFFLSSADFSKLNFSKNSFKVSYSVDQDQDQRSVGPDLIPNCLQRLSEDDNIRLCQARS